MTETPSQVVATTPLQRPGVRSLRALALFPWRHPWRSLLLLVLTAVVLLVAAGIWLLLWTEHHLRAARRAVERGHNWSAIRHLRACRTFRPEAPEKLLLCARVARRSGSFAEAEELLDHYWRKRGDDAELVLERLLLRAAQGELESVAPLLRVRIQQGDATQARDGIVQGLLYRFHLDEAKQLLDDWLKADPDNTLALAALGKYHELRENNVDAMMVYRRLLELDPEHDEVRLRLIRFLVRYRQGDEALAQADYLSRRLPDNPDVAVQRSRALDLQGRTAEARAVLDACLAAHPNHPAARIERAQHARRDDDGNRAEDDLRLALRLDPSDLSARYQFYLTLNQNGKTQEALQEQETIRQMESDIRRINALTQGQLQAAPDNPELIYEVAMIARRAGRPAETLRWLRNALQSNPDHLPTHRALAQLYHDLGNPILAARHRAIAQRLHTRGR